MFGHDIIVIGTSAGGLKALSKIVGNLPADLNAVIFIVQHIAPDKPSLLPSILEDVCDFPVTHPQDGEKFQKGRIYIAPPDHHLLVYQGQMRVVRGPQENRFRPAIDALFRSAARAYGPRVVGVVLTGYLDDGTVGLQAVKKRGGVAIVQDPHEAQYSSMPNSALRYASVDHCLCLAEIAELLVSLTKEPAAEEKTYPVTQEIEFESNIAEQQMNTQQFLENVEKIGQRTTYSCPECNGSIWQIGDGDLLRFRCHIGHAFTANIFLSEQTKNIENTLWSAVRALEEKVTLSRQMAQRMKNINLSTVATKYENNAQKIDEEVSALRNLILTGFATKQNIFFKDEELEEGL
ncbi:MULTISPECIES: chemotaxis protein CheB [Trichocoleus]|uniref:protein-glutamate methylesterase n=1 Tax=Trichocoleus desertorum GB2-A4 TaxID=2933944 RepID=A0ABV0J8Z6_9CYAN|nr:chemotaxis protein CheB [Trichocoleus sp. FACHB-46]MBD1864636.1 chemotaxis protein CheB [Trichocoleus sp. FACHB-46]